MSKKTDKKRVTDLILNNVRCFLCNEEFYDPVILDCFHTFCRDCIIRHAESLEDESDTMKCPLCDAENEKPTGNGDNLKKNVYFNLNKSVPGVSCHICGEEEFAKARCVECEQDFCNTCLNYHEKMTATREHHIVAVGKNHLSEKVKRKLFCKKHVDEELRYYCLDCEELLCRHCNMTTHKSHTSKYITDVSDMIVKRLFDAVHADEYVNYLCWLADRKQEFSNEINKMKQSEKQAVKDINDHARLLYNLIDSIREQLLEVVTDETNKKLNPLKERNATLGRNILSFAGVYLYAKKILNHADENEIVANNAKLKQKLEESKFDHALPTVDRGESIHFDPHEVQKHNLIPFFGRITKGDPDPENETTFIGDFKSESASTISSILPTVDGRAWVVEGMERILKLYDVAGRVHKTIELGVPADDILQGADDDTIYVSCNSGKEVKVIHPDFEITTLVNTDQCARGLALDNTSGTLIVCLTEKNAFFDHDLSHNNRLVRVIINGQKRWELPDVLSYAGYPVVEYPARLTITKTGYVAVSDWNRNCVTILNGTGHIETEYFGLRRSASSEAFCPRGICCDKYGRIFVADYSNSRIIQLDEVGQVFQTVLTSKDGIEHPWSVSVGPDGQVWIGNKEGLVTVHSIQQPAETIKTDKD